MNTLPPRLSGDTQTTQPFEPDGRVRADFATVEDFIASGAFDEAVLRAGKRGVERAMAQNRTQGLDDPAKRR